MTVSENQEIRLAQERLKAAGFDPGPIDGKLGPQTKSALEKYRASHKLTNSGIEPLLTIDRKAVTNLSRRRGTNFYRSFALSLSAGPRAMDAVSTHKGTKRPSHHVLSHLHLQAINLVLSPVCFLYPVDLFKHLLDRI